MRLLRNYNQEGLTSAFGSGVFAPTRIRDLTVTPVVQVVENLPIYYQIFVTDTRNDFRNETETGIAKLPEVYNGFYDNATHTLLDYTIPIYKDNREKLSITVQHEFCSNTTDIVIGPSMVLSAAVIRGFGEKVNTRFRYSTTHTYSQYDKVGVGTLFTGQSFTISSNSIILTTAVILSMISGAGSYSNVKSWAITDIDGNLIVGVNKSTTNIPSTIRLNILKTRQPV